MSLSFQIPRSTLFFVMLAEASIAVAVVGVGAWTDRLSRPEGPESVLTTYATAVRRHELDVALAQLAPQIREEAAPFVAWQLGNRYLFLESALRTASVLDLLTGRDTVQSKVIVTMEVDAEDGTRWRTTEEIPVQHIEGRWYLMKAPLQPAE